jgi:hypothetical protein
MPMSGDQTGVSDATRLPAFRTEQTRGAIQHMQGVALLPVIYKPRVREFRKPLSIVA